MGLGGDICGIWSQYQPTLSKNRRINYRRNRNWKMVLANYSNWTNSMQQSPAWYANSRSDSQEIPRHLCNLSLPVIPTANQMHSAHTFPPYFPNIHSKIIFHLRPGLPRSLFPSGFPTKILYAFFISPVRATCPIHIIPLDLISLLIFT